MMKHRLLCVVFVVLLLCFNLFSACKLMNGGNNMTSEPQQKVQILTELQPIYNHFPGLPQTERVEWCSTESEGIGPTTVNLYAFAFFTDDAAIDEILKQYALSENTVEISSPFYPKDVNQN